MDCRTPEQAGEPLQATSLSTLSSLLPHWQHSQGKAPLECKGRISLKFLTSVPVDRFQSNLAYVICTAALWFGQEAIIMGLISRLRVR